MCVSARPRTCILTCAKGKYHAGVREHILWSSPGAPYPTNRALLPRYMGEDTGARRHGAEATEGTSRMRDSVDAAAGGNGGQAEGDKLGESKQDAGVFAGMRWRA